MDKLIRILFAGILTGLSLHPVVAQEQDLDSIRGLLETYQDQDTTRINLLLTAASNLANISPEEAFIYIDEARNIVTQIKWPQGQARVYRQEGDTYYRMGVYLKSLEAYQKALRSEGFANDRLEEAKLYSNIANIYADLKEFDDAITNYEQYLSIATALDNIPNQINALANLGTVYSEVDRMDESIAFHTQALNLAKQQKMNFAITAIINNLGLTHKRKEDYQTSLDLYEQARALSVTHGYKHIEASALNSLGKVHLILENYDTAGQYAEEALVLAKEVESLEWQADSWQILSTVYENQGNMPPALLAYKNFVNLKDSISNAEKKVEFTKKDMQYRLETQQSLANAEIGKQRVIRNASLAIGLLIFLSAVISYFVYRRRRDILEQKKEAEFNTQVAETELRALRSQMNPHFIFNSLNSISDYIAKNDTEKADLYLLKFSKLMRAILENSEQKWISLNEELAFIKLYLEVEALRLPGKLTYSFSVEESLDSENVMVPPMITQPFIENSIWHGIAPKKEPGHISLKFNETAGMLSCVVEDDGIGRQATVNGSMNKTSLGLKITKNRLAIINRIRNVTGNIEMIDKEQGLKVILTLPLELRF